MYANWQVKDLKDELKKRGASLRGKKADLIERLELYDKNSNFGRPEHVDDDELEMELPSKESYRDINSDTILPPLNKTMIRHYLCYTEKKMTMATQLYERRHLLMARSSVIDDNTYIKGYYRKAMKNLQYEVDIKLNKHGNPEASHCECPAGSGGYAACKHVAVLLLGIETMVNHKILLLQEICTPRLEQFHVPRKLVKAEKMHRKKKKESLIFEPYPLHRIDRENYNDRIRNMIINFPNSQMPFKQLYGPANLYALEYNHQYTK